MNRKNKIIIYGALIFLLFTAIFVIWAIDTGRIASRADVGPTVQSAAQLQTLPNPDQSTFSKIFGIILSPFLK